MGIVNVFSTAKIQELLASLSSTYATKAELASVGGAFVAKATMTTEGDILVATAASTPARLAVGTNGYKLTPKSDETTGLIWRAPGEDLVNTVAATGAAETLSAAYTLHKVTMDQACVFAFTSPTEGAVFAVNLVGAFTPTWPASVDWPDGAEPTYTSPSLYVFATFDGGTTWQGFQAGKDIK